MVISECPSDLLERPSAEKLNYWLSCFVVGRRVDGQPYPSSTLYQLLAGLLRFSRSKSEDCPSDSVDVFQSREILTEKSDYAWNSWIHVCWFKQLSINISPQTMVINIQQPANTAKWILVYYIYLLLLYSLFLTTDVNMPCQCL